VYFPKGRRKDDRKRKKPRTKRVAAEKGDLKKQKAPNGIGQIAIEWVSLAGSRAGFLSGSASQRRCHDERVWPRLDWTEVLQVLFVQLKNRRRALKGLKRKKRRKRLISKILNKRKERESHLFWPRSKDSGKRSKLSSHGAKGWRPLGKDRAARSPLTNEKTKTQSSFAGGRERPSDESKGPALKTNEETGFEVVRGKE